MDAMLNGCCCSWSWSDYSPVSHNVKFTYWHLQALALKVDWKCIQYLLFNISAHCLCVCRWSFKMTGYWLGWGEKAPAEICWLEGLVSEKKKEKRCGDRWLPFLTGTTPRPFWWAGHRQGKLWESGSGSGVLSEEALKVINGQSSFFSSPLYYSKILIVFLLLHNHAVTPSKEIKTKSFM